MADWYDRYFNDSEGTVECAVCGGVIREGEAWQHEDGAVTCKGECSEDYKDEKMEEVCSECEYVTDIIDRSGICPPEQRCPAGAPYEGALIFSGGCWACKQCENRASAEFSAREC